MVSPDFSPNNSRALPPRKRLGPLILPTENSFNPPTPSIKVLYPSHHCAHQPLPSNSLIAPPTNSWCSGLPILAQPTFPQNFAYEVPPYFGGDQLLQSAAQAAAHAPAPYADMAHTGKKSVSIDVEQFIRTRDAVSHAPPHYRAVNVATMARHLLASVFILDMD